MGFKLSAVLSGIGKGLETTGTMGMQYLFNSRLQADRMAAEELRMTRLQTGEMAMRKELDTAKYAHETALESNRASLTKQELRIRQGVADTEAGRLAVSQEELALKREILPDQQAALRKEGDERAARASLYRGQNDAKLKGQTTKSLTDRLKVLNASEMNLDKLSKPDPVTGQSMLSSMKPEEREAIGLRRAQLSEEKRNIQIQLDGGLATTNKPRTAFEREKIAFQDQTLTDRISNHPELQGIATDPKKRAKAIISITDEMAPANATAEEKQEFFERATMAVGKAVEQFKAKPILGGTADIPEGAAGRMSGRPNTRGGYASPRP